MGLGYQSDSLASFSYNKEKPGATLIHELVHAWQLHHSVSVLYSAKALGDRWSDWTGGHAYDYKLDPDKKFSEFSMEQQAAIVKDWFTAVIDEPGGLDGQAAQKHAAWPYIVMNIRAGNLGA
jgi:hypothetical protein